MRIALLGNGADKAKWLKPRLEEAGHVCVYFESGRNFLNQRRRDTYDLLILDWTSPMSGGLEIVKQIGRGRMPVFLALRRDREQDIAKALDAGVDGCITHPIRIDVLLARLKAAARRFKFDYGGIGNLSFAPYAIDVARRIVTLDSKRIELSPKEYELTVLLFKNAGQVLSRDHLLDVVWGAGVRVNSRTVDTHMSRLRSKLALTAANGWSLSSVYQQGYRLQPEILPE